MMKITLAAAAAALIVTGTPLFVGSPAQSQVNVGPVEVGPKGVTVGQQTKPKCRTVTTTTETPGGRKVTKKERVCDEH